MQKRNRMIATTCALSVMVSLAARAQTPVDTTHHAVDSAAAQPKKGGMFGKMKGLAHNKTAQNIAKAAACTALPGGQYMVGAIDAKQNKSAGAVATTAATAAAGAGAGCIPGVGGLAGMGGSGGTSGIAGAALGGAGAKSGIAGAALGGLGGSSRAAMAQKAMSAGGNAQTMSSQMQAMSAMQQGANGGATLKSDAPGQQMQLSGAVASELAKGKLVIKKVDWVQHGNLPSAPSMQSLIDVMSSIGVAIKQNGAKYRVDVYVGKDYSDTEAKQLAPSRVTTVIGMINDGADVESALVAGKAERDSEPRIEIVKVK